MTHISTPRLYVYRTPEGRLERVYPVSLWTDYHRNCSAICNRISTGNWGDWLMCAIKSKA